MWVHGKDEAKDDMQKGSDGRCSYRVLASIKRSIVPEVDLEVQSHGNDVHARLSQTGRVYTYCNPEMRQLRGLSDLSSRRRQDVHTVLISHSHPCPTYSAPLHVSACHWPETSRPRQALEQ